MLDEQDALPVIVGERMCVKVGPVCHAQSHRQSLLIAGVLAHVDKSGDDLMISVERRPYFLMIAQAVIGCCWICAQIAVFCLALGKHGYKIVGLARNNLIAGARMHE